MIIVLDIGKTKAKLTLWTASGEMVDHRTRLNERIVTQDYMALDTDGIERWLVESLRDFSAMGKITALFPIAHGAGLAVIREDNLILSPLDYENPIPQNHLAAYREQRDSFSVTGSPALPDGLNLGSQLHWLEALDPEILKETTLLLWPQYWAWRFSGVAASEVTSLGCHSDLWHPNRGAFSALAQKRGWAKLMAPIRPANDILGPLTQEWVRRTGLPDTVKIYCGIHDSNAALIAARGYAEIADNEATVLSTGTWFIAMRSPGQGIDIDISTLPETRDCLVNVDAFGKPTLSSRFMGGREIETLIGKDNHRIDIKQDQTELIAAVPQILTGNMMILPCFTPGSGPYPKARGKWLSMPDNWMARRAAVCLYAALVADKSLDMIGAEKSLLIEGRFAEADVFVRALATLRPHMRIYTTNTHNDVSRGALLLLNPELKPISELVEVKPLDNDLSDYKSLWKQEIQKMEGAIS